MIVTYRNKKHSSICKCCYSPMFTDEGFKVDNLKISLCDSCRKDLCSKLVQTLFPYKFDEDENYILEDMYEESKQREGKI